MIDARKVLPRTSPLLTRPRRRTSDKRTGIEQANRWIDSVQQPTMIEGGCLCGKIRYRASGAPQGAGYCHCRSCRHHTGAPVAAFAVFTAEQVQWVSGQRTRYESSPGVFRGFCGECGTSMTFEANDGECDLVELHVSTLDSPETVPPNEHTHYGERISWLRLVDDSPRYPASMK